MEWNDANDYDDESPILDIYTIGTSVESPTLDIYTMDKSVGNYSNGKQFGINNNGEYQDDENDGIQDSNSVELISNQHIVASPNVSGVNFQGIATCALQDWKSFFHFTTFNKIQSNLFSLIFTTRKNLVVSAPTGAGKTVLFELSILKMLEIAGAKAVYIAPTRALCEERFADWNARFKKFNVKVLLLTGDSPFLQGGINNSRLIVTTPEKWDSITRQHDNRNLFQMVKLVCIDEIHGIKDQDRGATLEVVVTRAKYQQCRLIAVSATIPNISDFGIWLNAETKLLRLIRLFGEEYRAVPIQKIVVGFPTNYNQFQFNENLKFQVLDIVKKYSNSKPTIVFCSTRKDVIGTAQELSSRGGFVFDFNRHNR